MKDKFGSPITIGSFLIHPMRKGSSCWLDCIEVTGIGPTHVEGIRGGKPVRLTKTRESIRILQGDVGYPVVHAARYGGE